MEGVMIPYTAERRPDTGVSNGTLGIWLFLASETMLFGALFSAYALLRTSATDWPASGREILGTTSVVSMTFALFGVTAMIWTASKPQAKTRHFPLLLSASLAVCFLGFKSLECSSKVSAGLLPSSSMFLALYFTLTGFHALHVLGGIAANLWVARGVWRLDEAITTGRLKALALYWSFVDVVWVAILVAFYAT
jgi:heme/copper-type cytochrome/quinol oxidase subunit 3